MSNDPRTRRQHAFDSFFIGLGTLALAVATGAVVIDLIVLVGLLFSDPSGVFVGPGLLTVLVGIPAWAIGLEFRRAGFNQGKWTQPPSEQRRFTPIGIAVISILLLILILLLWQ